MINRCFTATTIIYASIIVISAFICEEVQTLMKTSQVRFGVCYIRHCRNLTQLSSRIRSTPTVLNPITKRRIHLGGPKYSELIREGGWVQHGGSLERLDLNLLSHFQRGKCRADEQTSQKISLDENEVQDNWYTITPNVVKPEVPANREGISPITNRSTMDEITIRKLRQELLFVNKPSGLHCVPSRSLSDSLASQVCLSYPTSKPCHRLDRDTSGIVLFGLTKNAHREVSMQFEARTTSKTYIALVAGQPKEDSGIINLPIGKQKTKEGFNRWTIGGEKPRESVTKWTVDKVFHDEETGASYTRVKLKPITGRGHQLRLHMKAIGCPILGDTIHGPPEIAMCSSRLCLHAQTLQVDWKCLRIEANSVSPF